MQLENWASFYYLLLVTMQFLDAYSLHNAVMNKEKLYILLVF